MEIELETKALKRTGIPEATEPLVHSHIKYAHPKKKVPVAVKAKVHEKTSDIGNFKYVKGD